MIHIVSFPSLPCNEEKVQNIFSVVWTQIFPPAAGKQTSVLVKDKTLQTLRCLFVHSLITNSLSRYRHCTKSLCCAKSLPLCPTLCDPMDFSVTHQAPLSADSPGMITGVGCHFLLQKIFPPQRSNLGLLHCRQILYGLSHQGSANIYLFGCAGS